MFRFAIDIGELQSGTGQIFPLMGEIITANSRILLKLSNYKVGPVSRTLTVIFLASEENSNSRQRGVT
jgi:hypothetical protein